MIQVRRSKDRGHFDHGWLNTYHTFSFGDYHDNNHMGFRSLRVINEDVVKPGEGFPRHGHKDMEIITYILDGSLQHKDSLGTGSIIKPGELQHMSAGQGVLHSEYNHSKTDLVHLLQIWILPKREGISPAYNQKEFPIKERQNALKVLASPDGREGSLKINQDALVLGAILSENKKVQYTLEPSHGAWIQVAKGNIKVNGQDLGAGDGAAIERESQIEVIGVKNSEFLLFDLI